MKHEDITRGFIFALDGEQYTAQEIPSNNGNFRATDSRGKLHHINAADVLRAAKYQHPSNDENGRRICRICGAVIINGITGAAMFDTCNTCTPPPRYPKPSSRTIYSAEESDILEARATSINFDYD